MSKFRLRQMLIGCYSYHLLYLKDQAQKTRENKFKIVIWMQLFFLSFQNIIKSIIYYSKLYLQNTLNLSFKNLQFKQNHNFYWPNVHLFSFQETLINKNSRNNAIKNIFFIFLCLIKMFLRRFSFHFKK